MCELCELKAEREQIAEELSYRMSALAGELRFGSDSTAKAAEALATNTFAKLIGNFKKSARVESLHEAAPTGGIH